MPLLFVLVSATCLAAEKPVALSLGEVNGKEAGILLPSAQVSAACILVLQIIWGLVSQLQKRKSKRLETNSYTALMELVHRLDEKVKAMPTEDSIVRRIRSEMELIAIKTAREEFQRRVP